MARPRWSDEQWEAVWERGLGHVERYRIARATWSRRPPTDPEERAIMPELARRWQRTARNHVVFHLLWVLFWGAIAWAADPAEGPAEQLAGSMALFSAAVIGVALSIRSYLDPIAAR